MSLKKYSPWLAILLLLALFLTFQLMENIDPTAEIVSTEGLLPTAQVYFSAPWDPSSTSLRGGPDAQLASAIEAARYSVDMAIYKLDLWSLRDALLDAHRRGVVVRLVVESDYADEEEIQALATRDIPIREDQHDSLMHHKFTVIDGYEVWTGSMNYSVNGAYRHNNNLLRIRSYQLAANFTREFEEMFLEGRFGGLSRQDTPYPVIDYSDGRMEVYFSPDDGVEAHLVDVLNEAEARIDMLAFSITSDAIGEALLDAADRGVAVRLVVEQDQANNTGSEVERLQEAGIPVQLDRNPNSMHHKVILIDGEIVITGSYNFSWSAEAFNDENVIILYDPGLAADYLVEFNRIFDQSIGATDGRESERG